MDWTDVMAQRDHLLRSLQPLLDARRARERANDVIQALVWCEDEPPRELVLRLLLRDLEGRDARAVTVAALARWQAFRGASRPAKPRLGDGGGPTAPRARRETRMLGVH